MGRDGSCFFRAYLFRIMEYLIESKNKDICDKLINKIKECTVYMVQAGFESIVFED